MKKENLLSKAEMRKVLGGSLLATCLEVGSACTGNVQCCSNVCQTGSGSTTGAVCAQTSTQTD